MKVAPFDTTEALRLYHEEQLSGTEIAKKLGVGQRRMYVFLRQTTQLRLPGNQRNRIIKICLECGKSFEVRPSEL